VAPGYSEFDSSIKKSHATSKLTCKAQRRTLKQNAEGLEKLKKEGVDPIILLTQFWLGVLGQDGADICPTSGAETEETFSYSSFTLIEPSKKMGFCERKNSKNASSCNLPSKRTFRVAMVFDLF